MIRWARLIIKLEAGVVGSISGKQGIRHPAPPHRWTAHCLRGEYSLRQETPGLRLEGERSLEVCGE